MPQYFLDSAGAYYETILPQDTASGHISVPRRPQYWSTWNGAAWIDGRTLEQAKAERLEALVEQRRRARDGGITVGGVPVPTDKDTRDTLTAARLLIQIDPLYSIPDWKVGDGVWTTLSAAQITIISEAVAAHVQACFTRERALSDAITAASDKATLDAIDIEAGWPA